MRKSFAVLACLSPFVIFACSQAPKGEQIKEGVSVQLPLSAACGQCAEGALATACRTERDACDADAECLDAAACSEGCAPEDGACVAHCAHGSAAFIALVDCVACDACASDCGGSWTCPSPQPSPPHDPGGPDASGSLQECEHCILEDSSDHCRALGQACLASGACVQLVQCVEGCGDTDACVAHCSAGASQATLELFSGLRVCASTPPCIKACGGLSSPPGPPNACIACATQAAENECADLAAACQATPGCTTIALCVSRCDTVACAEACFVGDAAAVVAARHLGECAVCDVCSDICPQAACEQM